METRMETERREQAGVRRRRCRDRINCVELHVIYALNTKNDEHEANIQALKDAHEEEIQHIRAETRKTILQYKSKAEEEKSLRKRIQVLEDAVDQHRRLKEEALAELTLFKKQVKELRMEVKQAEILSTDTGDTNADFEDRLLHLNQQHEGLLNECKALREIFDTKEILDKKHSVEEQALIKEMENQKSENQSVTEECTQKSSQLQDSCEREKETLQQAIQQSMAEQQKNCQQRELEPRKSLEAQEVFLLQQVKKLEVDLEEKTWKVNERKKHSQKMKERIQVAQLKQMLEQQASNFKESLKKQNLQAIKEKEKLLQDLQNTIKENQNVKLQLEASHQKILKMLEKSKNRELKEAEERLKREFNESFKTQHHSHKLEIETLEERAKKELHDELEEIQKEQTLLLGSVRLELSEQQALCTSLRKQIAELQEELHRVRTLRKHQEGSSQSQLRSLHDELEKSQHEVSGLKKENLLLKDTMELLSAELGSQKQEAAQLQDREKQHRRLLIEDLQVKHSKELDALKQDHQKEMENVLCDFSSTQAHLQAKIFSLETELKELEEKSRKQEARAEDKHLVSCLQDKIREREEIIKQLVEGRKFQHSLLANTESYRSRSFSFNPSLGCLTPSMKQKKVDEGPSRVISVPNLASYAKSFLSCDLRPRRSASQVPKSTSLEQSSPASRAPRRAELPPGHTTVKCCRTKVTKTEAVSLRNGLQNTFPSKAKCLHTTQNY
ncbi:protein FAM184B isoform X2 [Nothoprocta perdicaria]|uniref:protein FAM184B isoform X2 n=1 Tax=Nothoprocta perdicaria TaxID=30464 RepID=UPI000E1C2040|nr:protein FAM184B isoform X2 [Nothoprocta perdicaria]